MVDSNFFEDVEGFEEFIDLLDQEDEVDIQEAGRIKKRVERHIRRNIDEPELTRPGYCIVSVTTT